MSFSDSKKNCGTHRDSSFMLGRLRPSSENPPDKSGGSVNAKDWVSFQKSLRDPERIKRQEMFFAELDNMEIKENPDGSVDIPFEPRRNKNDKGV